MEGQRHSLLPLNSPICTNSSERLAAPRRDCVLGRGGGKNNTNPKRFDMSAVCCSSERQTSSTAVACVLQPGEEEAEGEEEEEADRV